MSNLAIKIALEQAIASITPTIQTVWENTKFKPTTGVPYQYVQFLPFITVNAEIGPMYEVRSYVQIDLYYPIENGTADALIQADIIKSFFKRGFTFANSGITVTIIRTAVVSSGSTEGSFWKVPVKIYYNSFINA
jgi:hypothetical protein